MTPRLLIRSGLLENQEFQLKPGTNHIGRAEANDICIGEPSVSSSHCQIVVGEEATTIIDLNSTNGTFVEQAPIQSARLKPGDVVRLGNVACVFVADSPTVAPAKIHVRMASYSAPQEPPRLAPPLPPPIPGIGVPESGWCRNHPSSPARYYCKQCAKAFCELCVAVRHTGHAPIHTCRACSSECLALTKLPEAHGLKATRFYAALPQAFTYPFKADGLVLLAVGTLIYSILHYATKLASFAPLIGLVAVIILTVFGGGFLFSFMKGIVTSTAQGNDALPDWPDVSEWAEDILMPFGQMLATLIFSFLPVVALFVAELSGAETAWWMWTAAFLLGCVYYPMGLLSVAMHDTVAGLNPLLIVVSILRVPGDYATCCLVLAGVFLIRLLIVTYLPAVLPVPIIPTVVAGFIGLYLLTVLMRILGLLYFTRKADLGWFKG